MALTITVNGAGTFTASMEEGPVSFSASLGAIGPAGPGVAAGGTTGQILVKTSNADYATGWIDNAARTVFVTARNNTGSTIAKGAVVYLSGATGNKATIALAQSNSEATSSRTIGITKAEIANNADGDVIISGEVTNIDTSAFTAGQVVYLSATTAGGLTTTLPTQPNHGVVIGIVTRSNANNGSIEVTVQNYQELSELSDVLITSKQANDLLAWDSTSSVWKNKSFSTLGLLTSATAASTYLAKASNLSDLSSASTARTNLGLGTMAVETATDYLSKAGNLSGLASTSTARTNLGLGTMATETASDYLTKAGNLSGLASNATARTNLDVYSKSESDALVPAASTTTAGKVELATDAEAIDALSNSLALTPYAGLEQSLACGRAYIRGMSTNTSGTGAVATSEAANAFLVQGPTTAIGHGAAAASIRCQRRGSWHNSSFNFTKPVVLSCRIVRTTATPSSNSIFRLIINKNSASIAPVGDIVAGDNAIELKIAGSGTMDLLVANATTLTTVTSTWTPSDRVSNDLKVYSNNGTVSVFVDGVQVATTNAGPTQNVITQSNRLQEISVQNINTTTVACAYIVANLYIHSAG